MSYPPQPGPPRYGNPRHPGHPQHYGYPQQQAWPHTRQRPGYPAAQYGPPGRAMPPPNIPVRPSRKPRLIAYFVALFLVLGGGGVAMVSALTASRPEVGDCLTSMDARLFGGLEIVDCDDPGARYEVVNKLEHSRGSVCVDHPDGESYASKGRHGKVYWSICATPK